MSADIIILVSRSGELVYKERRMWLEAAKLMFCSPHLMDQFSAATDKFYDICRQFMDKILCIQ
jgi:hypothetical protein